MGTRYSAIDPQFMTDEDKIACGLLTAESSLSNPFDSIVDSKDEVVDLQKDLQ